MKIALVLFFISVSSFSSNYNNKVSGKISISINGGSFDASYERKITPLFALESGFKIEEKFLVLFNKKLNVLGAFIGTNFYFKKWKDNHQIFISTKLDALYGNFTIQTDSNNNLQVLSLTPSVLLGYIYKFSFNATVETGLAIEPVSLIIPKASFYSLPTPRLYFGIGYVF